MAFTHRSFRQRFNRHDLVMVCADAHLATRAAIRTRGSSPVCWLLMHEQRLVSQGPAWAGIHTGAAADAGTFPQRSPRVRNYPRFVSSIKDLPDKLSLDLIADADAAITDNASRHIDVNVRMGVVQQVRFVRAVEV